eukprot:5455494-Pleurochrysis_carterae.AAC.1
MTIATALAGRIALSSARNRPDDPNMPAPPDPRTHRSGPATSENVALTADPPPRLMDTSDTPPLQ